MIDLKSFWQAECDEHVAVMNDTRQQLQPAFEKMLGLAVETIRKGGKILFLGNGGSASDAQHLATELTVRFKTNRDPIAALALTTDTSALTAIGNDFGFDHLFSRQIAALGKAGDLAICISTSGNSPNVLNAIAECKKQNIKTVAFTGKTGGKMQGQCDVMINVPSTTTARIQEMHIMIGQMLCGALEIALGLVQAEAGKAARAV
jgi:D-sedoheptulose 7-phosphate isomerase